MLTCRSTGYGDSDPDDPQNWSSGKKSLVTAIICTLTFAVYVGSSLITSGFPSLTSDFGIGYEEATVTLSIYVLAYGLGALFFSPLSEIPAFGRNPFCEIPLFSDLREYLLTASRRLGSDGRHGRVPGGGGAGADVHRPRPASRLDRIHGLPSPQYGWCDIGRHGESHCPARNSTPLRPPHVYQYKPAQLPIVFSIWVLPAFSAPAVGPVFGNFAAQANGWRWTMYELLWIVGFTTIFLIFVMPETVRRSRLRLK